MCRFLVFTFLVLLMSIQASFGQNSGLGNVYQSGNNVFQTFRSVLGSGSSKEQKALQKEISEKARQNKNNFEENFQELKARGYTFPVLSVATNYNLKTLLAIDDKLIELQAELDSKIQHLNNADLIDSMKTPVQNAQYYGSTDDIDYNFLSIRDGLTNRLAKLREAYSNYENQGSSETNDWYVTQALAFNKPDDQEKLNVLEQRLVNRKQLYQQSLAVIAQHNQQEADAQKRRRAADLAEEKQKQAEAEQLQAAQHRRDSIIATLPSKAAVRAMFRNYRHKTGRIFEMFPVGFTPKPNKAYYDKVTIWGRTYIARYRETNAYGFNSVVFDFYDSGRIKEITVFNGADVIYTADYKDVATNKAYSIITQSADGKFSLTLERTYNIQTDKVEEIVSYEYVPLGYYYGE